jgi:UPF0755 protein
MRTVRIAASVLALAAVSAFLATQWMEHVMTVALPVKAPMTLVVEKGSNLKTIARDLEARGALPHPRLWVWQARRLGLAGRIHAGDYEIAPGTTSAQLLDKLVKGDVILRELTIVEGSTFADLRRALAAHPAINHTLREADAATVMARIGAPGVHPEGQFFPDTYRFAAGTTDFEILKQAHDELRRRLAAAWAARAAEVPLANDYEALILASIVEKESALPIERARIAGVFVRRLRLGMRLQSDPTVIYGLGETYDGNIRRRDLQADTAFNTYTRAGLPPTPIALPGEGALRATVRPDDSGALYFVATGEPDGSHYFSATLAEHDAAVRRFLARVRARNARVPAQP